jgi:hypothetical protein
MYTPGLRYGFFALLISFCLTNTAFAQLDGRLDMERQCCPFLTFKIVVETAGETMRGTSSALPIQQREEGGAKVA